MRGWLRSAVAVVCLAAAAATLAQSVAYTVQVVALSDVDAAQGVQVDLLRDGYPAYIVRSTSSQGDVWRVRVGAFANRAAALLYATGMPQVGGAQPVPALAESIPFGIMPLAPLVLFDEPLNDRSVTVGTLGDQLIVRLQANVGQATDQTEDEAAATLPAFQPAEYVIIVGTTIERRGAWRFGEVEGAHLWVREALVWPATWRDETDEVREGFRSSLLRLLAERLGVEVAEV
ncbi:MAG TPA: SPOR domain-containing protein, partial [Trueperaceae bacterium]|nr:SPOR domain-containing protein [Trueperaceae bacterium]